MSESDFGLVRCTPTDPSIEFDLLEMVRHRLVESLTGSGSFGLIEAERIALYVIGCARPVSKLLKVSTGAQPPSHGDVLEALSRVLDEAPALENARRLMLRAEEGGEDG